MMARTYLEWRHGDNENGYHAFPVCQQAVIFACFHDEDTFGEEERSETGM
jgi:hypothetical protein